MFKSDTLFIKDIIKTSVEKKLMLETIIKAVDALAKRLQNGDEKQEGEIVYRMEKLAEIFCKVYQLDDWGGKE